MTKILFNQIPDKEKIVIYQELGRITGMAPYAIEKDWWVVQTIAIIFEMEIGNHLVFKGGTSLSKAWGLIDRFSEDIDLALDRSFLGFNGALNKKERTNLRKATSTYISEELYPELESKFREKGLTGVELKIEEPQSSDQDPRIIEIYYPNVIKSPGYIQPKVQVEIGCRSLREPFTEQSFSSLVDENYPDAKFTQSSIKIPTVNPERTFLEKIFLLHEEFQRPEEKIRVDRLSRHLYDVYQLSKTAFAEKGIKDKELYETIVRHRYTYTKLGGVNYNLHNPKTINPIPPLKFIKDWEKDYKTMQEQMIYGESPSFNVMLKEIKEFTQKLNQIDWKFECEF
ncbi:MAG: nucleotidyl transferase AbiEii/AbiGii toxin family protein [Bacteroidetes bacterium HGW-Bacteroidetes-3]|jgi:predicted nucleotidyltransferase component of viral defense system|nr:MAG: nucleotidyl transferase AbiEii/AbiGii toxin family protein [Bacteroidetes bacterium HGW-Bacteroidetes-3]